MTKCTAFNDLDLPDMYLLLPVVLKLEQVPAIHCQEMLSSPFHLKAERLVAEGYSGVPKHKGCTAFARFGLFPVS